MERQQATIRQVKLSVFLHTIFVTDVNLADQTLPRILISHIGREVDQGALFHDLCASRKGDFTERHRLAIRGCFSHRTAQHRRYEYPSGVFFTVLKNRFGRVLRTTRHQSACGNGYRSHRNSTEIHPCSPFILPVCHWSTSGCTTTHSAEPMASDMMIVISPRADHAYSLAREQVWFFQGVSRAQNSAAAKARVPP